MIIEIEKNIPMPSKASAALNAEEIQALNDMEIGDSFIIKKYSHINRYRNYAKKMGKELIARKNYTGKTVDSYNFRVWFNRNIIPNTDISNSVKLPEGTLPKHKVSQDIRTNNIDSGIDTAHGIPQHIIDVAEMQNENKLIVEDIDLIKKILHEELGHGEDFKSWKWSKNTQYGKL